MRRPTIAACTLALAAVALLLPRHGWASCGDGVVDGAEECDLGAGNSDTLPDTCRTECELPSCGDSVIDTGEECDDGEANSDEIANRCREDCTQPRCGDGLLDRDDLCDDGNLDDADGCSSACVIEPGWVCYGQPSYCVTCGNGVLDGVHEECDDGPLNSDTEPDRCREDCRYAWCGDDVVDSGEECDDGELNADYVPNACRRACRLPTCGDGVVDDRSDEQCDDGEANSDEPGATCNTACLLPSCGNGVVDAGELCDDPEDPGCTPLCRPNVCGDGFVSAELEACDDGNNDDGDACRYDCRQDLSRCGDGVVDAGEACDLGAANSTAPDAACRPDCNPARCGDGVVDAGEQCDGEPGCGPGCVRLRR